MQTETKKPSADVEWLKSVGETLSPGDIVGGKYELTRLIGAGGMGAVVEARHIHLDEKVAVKILRPDLMESDGAVDRFVREAQTAFRIRSEHVTQIYDVGTTDDGVPYMAMELLDGNDLGQELEKRRCLPMGEAVDLFLQACGAVHEGHLLGIVHRDLKPENLFLTRKRDGSRTVKILDFGLSKAWGRTKSGRERSLTATSSAMGTPHYMSPEQWACAKTTGPATDIWALGVMLYELLTGRLPFEGDTIPEVYAKIIGTEPLSFASMGTPAPAGIETAILRCLTKDPIHRFGSVEELMLALAPFSARAVPVSSTQTAGSFTHAASHDPLGSTVAMSPEEAAPVQSKRIRSETEFMPPDPVSAIDLARPNAAPQRGHTMGAWHQSAPPAPPTRARWPIPMALLTLCVVLVSGWGVANHLSAADTSVTSGESSPAAARADKIADNVEAEVAPPDSKDTGDDAVPDAPDDAASATATAKAPAEAASASPSSSPATRKTPSPVPTPRRVDRPSPAPKAAPPPRTKTDAERRRDAMGRR